MVISAGTSVRESVPYKEAGAEPAGYCFFDRMERGEGNLSAVQEVQYLYDDIPVFSIATLADLVRYLERIVERNLLRLLIY